MAQPGTKTYTFYVHGMHCKSCVVLTEDVVRGIPGVAQAKAHLGKRDIEISGDFGDLSGQQIAARLSESLKEYGYTLSSEAQTKSVRWADFRAAVPVALGFIAVFVLLQKLGVVNLVQARQMGYGVAFAIGLIASVSTCMAVVGGLILSVSANFAKQGSRMRPQLFFHAGRLLSFFVLGGIVGSVGSTFQFGRIGTFVVGMIMGLVMLILGINLLDVFPWAKKLQPTLPAFLSKHMLAVREMNSTAMPLVLGAVTFFLPCGFTQSMQLYSLSTGNFMSGALTMLVFALGTLPVLSLLSFSSAGIRSKAASGIFFKAAGLVVVFFALFNIMNGLVAVGLIPPILSL